MARAKAPAPVGNRVFVFVTLLDEERRALDEAIERFRATTGINTSRPKAIRALFMHALRSASNPLGAR